MKTLPSKAKIKNAESGIAKIKSALVELLGLLKGNRSKLLVIKNRLRTPAQKSRYVALAKVQLVLEKSAKSQISIYKVLTNTMSKFKHMTAAVMKGTNTAAGRIWESAKKSVSWLVSKLRRKPEGVGDIESLDDLGVVPIVVWGIVVATITALSIAVGALLSKASKLEEQIDALNDEIDKYQVSAQPEESESESDEYEYEYEDEEI